MELEELKQTWAAYHSKVDQQLHLNQRILRETKLDKVRSRLRGLIINRTISASVIFLIISALYAFMATHFSLTAPTVSAAVLIVFFTIILISNIHQIALAQRIDYAQSVITIQQQLEEMNRHALCFLQLFLFSAPCYLAYIFLGVYLLTGVDFYPQADANWFTFQLLFSGAMLIGVLWFNYEIGRKPPRYRWAKKVVENIGGREIVIGMKFLQELKEFEKEE